MIHRGIKFSCRFTLSEIQSRWYALLYNAEISRIAVAAMKNLHPDIVASIRSKALFSNGEEELLSTLLSVSCVKICKYKTIFSYLLRRLRMLHYATLSINSLSAKYLYLNFLITFKLVYLKSSSAIIKF